MNTGTTKHIQAKRLKDHSTISTVYILKMPTTGRGHGRGLYSSGRGRGGWYRRTRSQQKTESKKTLQDYMYYIGSPKQASNYTTVTKFLINYIRKTYNNGNDITNALEDGKTVNTELWRPSLSVSMKDLTSQKAQFEAKTEEFKILYKAKLDSWIRRKDTYRSNVSKSYALLYKQCNKAMRKQNFKLTKISQRRSKENHSSC